MNTQVLLPEEDDGLSLEDDELVIVLLLELVDKFDEIAVTVLAKIFGAQVCQLIFGLDVVDTDLALLD